MSVLDQSVKKAIGELDGTDADFQDLLVEERAGKNRKTLVKWLEKQGGVVPDSENDMEDEIERWATKPVVDTSVPEVEPVYEEKSVESLAPNVAGIDSIEGGEMSISDLIAVLSEKRDRWQRSASCGLENIRVHLSEINITVR